MNNLPTGTVTFLFTDIEGSTPLWEREPEKMTVALERHHTLLRAAIESNGGQVFKIIGDAFQAAFVVPAQALAAALAAQRGLAAEAWPTSAPLRVRMGVHVGQAEAHETDYATTHTLNRVARIMSTAYSGQVLLSVEVAELTRGYLPAEATLRDMGQHRMKGMTQPEHLYQVLAPDLPADFPPLQTLDAFPNNLPTQLTSFIGREKEIAEIKALLHSSRLVTLTGSGGTGKTRLSIEVGTQELANFANGVWLIELAPLADPAQIIPALAQAFGLQELPFRPLANLVTDYLRDKKLLLILDNCEHLIAACARLADDLLHQCAGLKILASSREALGIAGEMAYRTPSLADSESTSLFVDRARAANSKFALTDSNASSVAQICRRLDGIPLAIELAAARTKLLSAEQIAARLDDLFRLLVGGSRTALPRQQTLRALIDWSYDLLSDEEKNLLRIASVFVGGWTLEALEAVSEDPHVLEHLEGLVNKSLVVTEEHESEMRYFLLETIRQYAREKLFEAKQSSAARDRHFFYFNQLSEEFWEALRSPNVIPMISKAEDEVENVRAALEWGLENHAEENLRLAANFCSISTIAGVPAEGVRVAATAVERAKAMPPAAGGEAALYRQKLIARALFAQGMVGLGVGNMPFVVSALREAIALSRATGDKQMLGYSLGTYHAASTFINAPDGEQAAQEALQIFTHEVNDSFGLGSAYMSMARLSANKGDEHEREKYFGKLREMVREMPRSFQVSMFHLGMGMDERMRGNYDTARKIFEEGLESFLRLHSKNFVMVMKSELGHVERQSGNLTQAQLIYKETIKGWQDLGNRSAVAHELECFAFLAIHDEEPERAAKLFGAAEALREKIQSPMTDYERVEYDQSVARLRAILAEAEFNALWTEGRAMTMGQAIAYALEGEKTD